MRALKGFGAKTEQAILDGMHLAETAGQRMYWAEADQIVAALRDASAELPGGGAVGVRRQLPARQGDGRRSGCPGDLDRPAAVMDCLATFAAGGGDAGRGDTKMSVRLDSRLAGRLARGPARIVRRRTAVLHRLEGAQHRAARPRQAAGTEDQRIRRVSRGRPARGARGRRHGRGRLPDPRAARLPAGTARGPPGIRLGRAGKLPVLVTDRDIQGDLHMHTTETDGLATLEEMAERRKRAA